MEYFLQDAFPCLLAVARVVERSLWVSSDPAITVALYIRMYYMDKKDRIPSRIPASIGKNQSSPLPLCNMPSLSIESLFFFLHTFPQSISISASDMAPGYVIDLSVLYLQLPFPPPNMRFFIDRFGNLHSQGSSLSLSLCHCLPLLYQEISFPR